MKQHLALSEHLASAPDHWEQRRFRHAATLRGEKNSRSDQPLLALSAAYGVRERGEGGLGRQAPSEGTISSYWKVRSGDLVVNPMWLIEGGISCSWLAGAVSPAYRVYVPSQDIDSRYLHHLLRSRPYIDQYNQYIRGLTTFDRSVSVEDFLEIPILVPPLSEQRRIADFLDAEVGRIDQTVGARHQQLQLAREMEKTDLSASALRLFADNGSISLRRVSAGVEQGWSPQCDDYVAASDEWAVLKTSSVSSGNFLEMEHKRLPAEVKPELRYKISDGDLLLTRGSGSQDLVGVPAVAETHGRKLLLSDLLYRVKMIESWSSEFVSLMLQSPPVRGGMSLLMRGQSGQTIKLRAGDVKSIEIPNVPADRQGELVNELQSRKKYLDDLRQAISISCGLLEERKRALITAAVTGQIDVTTARGADVT